MLVNGRNGLILRFAFPTLLGICNYLKWVQCIKNSKFCVKNKSINIKWYMNYVLTNIFVYLRTMFYIKFVILILWKQIKDNKIIYSSIQNKPPKTVVVKWLNCL